MLTSRKAISKYPKIYESVASIHVLMVISAATSLALWKRLNWRHGTEQLHSEQFRGIVTFHQQYGVVWCLFNPC